MLGKCKNFLNFFHFFVIIGIDYQTFMVKIDYISRQVNTVCGGAWLLILFCILKSNYIVLLQVNS